MSINRLGKYLTSSVSSRIWLAFFLVSVLMLCAIGFYQAAFGPNDEDVLDAAGLEQQSNIEAADNRVNPSQVPDSSFIYDVAIDDLAKADTYMNGQTVQVTGEVVGDRIIAENNPDYCWIALQSTDKSDAELSVYMPVSATQYIDTYGRYGHRGTILQVRGVFNIACVDHQGTSEMHSEHVALVSRGTIEKTSFSVDRLIPGLILFMIGSALILVFNVLKERAR